MFRRTLNTALPMRQTALDQAANEELRVSYPERFANRPNTWTGFDLDFLPDNIVKMDEEERTAKLEGLWESGGLRLWLGGLVGVLYHRDANDIVYNFWRDKRTDRARHPRHQG